MRRAAEGEGQATTELEPWRLPRGRGGAGVAGVAGVAGAGGGAGTREPAGGAVRGAVRGWGSLLLRTVGGTTVEAVEEAPGAIAASGGVVRIAGPMAVGGMLEVDGSACSPRETTDGAPSLAPSSSATITAGSRSRSRSRPSSVRDSDPRDAAASGDVGARSSVSGRASLLSSSAASVVSHCSVQRGAVEVVLSLFSRSSATSLRSAAPSLCCWPGGARHRVSRRRMARCSTSVASSSTAISMSRHDQVRAAR